ncbi:acyl-CoA thioesterase [Psychroflexus sp. ALD_RP9]|uniref:acyl-CoA thioesterase n=1 Tax=Psychroflexus sp. ALD_RP9 TaxID=2777186 RepID=UPI001A8CE2C5|nr:thioesterase family protein [Psychroflexus sp. ALD_RP9]QSS97141.1 acyl-CoA thioesterase [Psychroflexus sp. ALD_RP9]
MLKPSQTTIEIRYAETDQMGIVHHSNYAVYFEQARVEWLRNAGMHYHELEKKGVMLPLINLNVDFKKPLYFGDIIKVGCYLESLPNVKMKFLYNIKINDEIVSSSGSTTHVFMDAKSRRPIRCPQSILDLISG